MAARPLARIAWRNVRRNWRHSLGSMLSIVVGFIAIGLFSGYIHDLIALQDLWYSEKSMMGHLVVERRGFSTSAGEEDPYAYALREDAQAFIEEFLKSRGKDVEVFTPVLAVSGLASTGRSGVAFVGWAYDPPRAARVRGHWAWNATSGRPLHEAPSNSVVVGNGLASLLDCTPTPAERAQGADGFPIAEVRPFTCRQARLQLTSATEAGQLNVVDPQIVGMLDAGLKDLDSRFINLPLEVGQRLLDTRVVSFYVVRLADPASAEALGAELAEAGRARGFDLDAGPWQTHEFGDLYRRTMALFNLYRTFVVIIVVTIAGMSVFTTMLKAVNERVREIGTLRSLGYRRPHIVALFTMEAAMLALVAAAVGLAATTALSALIGQAGVSYKAGVASSSVPLTASLLPRVALFATCFLSGVAVLAAVWPARRAARLRIADALGHVA